MPIFLDEYLDLYLDLARVSLALVAFLQIRAPPMLFFVRLLQSLYTYAKFGGGIGSISARAPTPTLSTFLRLLAPVASDLPIGDVFKRPRKGSYLDLCTIIVFFLADKEGNSRRIVAALSASHSIPRWRNRHSTISVSISIR